MNITQSNQVHLSQTNLLEQTTNVQGDYVF